MQKISENNRQIHYQCEDECNEIEEQSACVIFVFTNNKLRVIDENNGFQEKNQEEVNIIILDDEVKKAIESKEAIEAIYASVKERNMTGVQRTEDSYCISESNITQSKKLKKKALATEALKCFICLIHL